MRSPLVLTARIMVFVSTGIGVCPLAHGQSRAGVDTIGTAAYPDGGLRRIGCTPVDPVGGGLYAGAIDSTQATPYALFGNTGNKGVPSLFKVRLNDGGADPTLVQRFYVDQTAYPGERAFQSIVIDTRSADVTQHYAYIINAAGNKILKVQMFPDAANLDAAPRIVQEYTAASLTNGIGGATIDLANGYAYFAGSGTGNTSLVQLNLDTGAMKTFSGLPTLSYWRMSYASNTVYMMAYNSLVRVKLGTAGSLTGATFDSLALPSTPGYTLAVEPTLPYAYIGTYKFGDTVTPGKFMKIRTDGAAMNLLGTVNLPNNAGTPTVQERYLSAGVMDPDSRCVVDGTDNTDPCSITKIFAGQGDALPTRLGALLLPQASGPGKGEDNIRSAVIDPRQGYVYYGCDTSPVNVLKIQYSQKGSIKGQKISLPAGAALTSVNFFSNLATPATDSSSGNIRLAIYDDSGGAPADLIWQSDPIANNVPAGGGWLSATNGLPTIAQAGDYWLAWQCDSTLDVPSYQAGAAGNSFIFNQPFGSFPSTISSAVPAGWESGLTMTSDAWSMYVDYAPEPGSVTLLLAGMLALLSKRSGKRQNRG